MLPPPDGVFDSRDELLRSARRFALNEGYALVIQCSKPNKVVIQCDRGGSYRGGSSKIAPEKASTRKIGCPFLLNGHKRREQWFLSTKHPVHNHERSADMSGHPICRRLDEEDVKRLEKLSKEGAKPRQILRSLKLNEKSSLVVARDVYNMRSRVRNRELKGKSMIAALADEFASSGFFQTEMDMDYSNSVNRLFVAPNASFKMLRKNYACILLDCTYKSNRFKMPVLHAMGFSPNNKTFSVCFCFLKSEKEVDFLWALGHLSKMFKNGTSPEVCIIDRELILMKALEKTFPGARKIFCQEHVRKSFFSNCKRSFIGSDDQWEEFMRTWNSIVQAKSQEDFEISWEYFRGLLFGNPSILEYLESVWVSRKEKFVNCWVDRHLHFGNKVTGRKFGAQSTLKSCLQISISVEIQGLAKRIVAMVKLQFDEFKSQNSSEPSMNPDRIHNSFFSNLIGKVSDFAVKAVLEKYLEAHQSFFTGTELKRCTNVFSRTMGLPCSHFLLSLLKENRNISLDHINPHWHLGLEEEITVEEEEVPELASFRPNVTENNSGNENRNDNGNGNENKNENGNENRKGNDNKNENGNENGSENRKGNDNNNENGIENLNGNENGNENVH